MTQEVALRYCKQQLGRARTRGLALNQPARQTARQSRRLISGGKAVAYERLFGSRLGCAAALRRKSLYCLQAVFASLMPKEDQIVNDQTQDRKGGQKNKAERVRAGLAPNNADNEGREESSQSSECAH